MQKRKCLELFFEIPFILAADFYTLLQKLILSF